MSTLPDNVVEGKSYQGQVSPIPRYLVVGSFIGLVILGLLWELWLAPLRPNGSFLVLKVIPLALAIPSLMKGKRYIYQWWSMLVLIYLTEGLVRATSDRGLSSYLAWVEVVLSTVAFLSILLYTKKPSKKSSASTPVTSKPL
jgi:uncharacterized membrane protein